MLEEQRDPGQHFERPWERLNRFLAIIFRISIEGLVFQEGEELFGRGRSAGSFVGEGAEKVPLFALGLDDAPGGDGLLAGARRVDDGQRFKALHNIKGAMKGNELGNCRRCDAHRSEELVRRSRHGVELAVAIGAG